MQTGNSKGSRLVIMLLGVAFWMSAAQLNGAYATTNNDDSVVTGDVINSKYLSYNIPQIRKPKGLRYYNRYDC